MQAKRVPEVLDCASIGTVEVHGLDFENAIAGDVGPGVLLADLDEPWKIISRGDEPILSPMEPYELAGHVPNVVFASSQIVEDDGNVKLYYGASDRYQCVADSSVSLLLEAALQR